MASLYRSSESTLRKAQKFQDSTLTFAALEQIFVEVEWLSYKNTHLEIFYMSTNSSPKLL